MLKKSLFAILTLTTLFACVEAGEERSRRRKRRDHRVEQASSARSDSEYTTTSSKYAGDESTIGGDSDAASTTTNTTTRSERSKSKKTQKSQRPQEKNITLNDLARQHQWLAGLTIGYRFDRRSAAEISFPVGSFSPFYLLPSLAYKYTFPQAYNKVRFYAKAGLAMPIARLKPSSAQTCKSWTEEQAERVHNKNAEEVLANRRTFKAGGAGLLNIGASYPVIPNFLLETAGNLLIPLPLVSNELKSDVLPLGMIISMQVSARFRLG